MTPNEEEVRFTLRFRPGMDDDLICWWRSLDGQHHGAKSQAVRDAIRRGLGTAPDVSVTPVLDLSELRQIVDSAITQGLARFKGQIGQAVVSDSGDEEDAKAEAMLDNLGMSLVLADDDDD